MFFVAFPYVTAKPQNPVNVEINQIMSKISRLFG
jgi:hypothetical protein